jgi:hypothetical protein
MRLAGMARGANRSGNQLARRITLRYWRKGVIPKAGAVQPVEGSSVD